MATVHVKFVRPGNHYAQIIFVNLVCFFGLVQSKFRDREHHEPAEFRKFLYIQTSVLRNYSAEHGSHTCIKERSHLRHAPPQPLLNTEHSLQVVQLLFIIVSDCSMLNPGPVKNSCDLCRKTIRKKQNAIECEKCLSWFHQKCMNMSDAHFKVLAEHPSYVWFCCTFGLPSFSSSLFLSEIETSNKYDVLSDSTHCSKDLTDSQPTVWSPGPPLQSSSPSHIQQRKRKGKVPRNIKILNINCQSVSAKKGKFLTVIEDENPDIVVGTESWLTPNLYSGEIFPQQYQVFRKDRKSDAHGGVFIATKLDLVALLREDLSHPNSELLRVQLQCHGGGRTII